MHTANYYGTIIEVAEDCPVEKAEIPRLKKSEKTIAIMQYEFLAGHPYQYTSDEIIFGVYAAKNNIGQAQLQSEREKFFSKGQPCLRSSPLVKRYGWGIHSDREGKVAIYAVESGEYKKFCKDKTVQHVKGMKSKRLK